MMNPAEKLEALETAESGSELVNRILSHRLQQDEIKKILGGLSSGDRETFLGTVAAILSKATALLEVTNRLSDSLSLDVLLLRMIEITTEAVNADRGTLFLNDRETGELFSRVAQGGITRELRFPNSRGIAGSVFQTGDAVIIHDAYNDERFNKDIDIQTGYTTRNIICAPVRTRSNEVIGALQLLNKRSGNFTLDDLKLLQAITSQASATLQNAQLFEQVQRAKEEETHLLECTTAISSELQLKPLLQKIMETTMAILNADRTTLFLYDEKTRELWSQVALGLENKEIRFPADRGIAGNVFTTGTTVNIPDAYSDPRFNPEVDRRTGYRTQSILCMPVINRAGKAIGVTQVLNKAGGPFTPFDEKKLRAFSSQASIAIENAVLFDEVLNMKNYNEGILESMKDGLITLNAGKIIEKCNAAVLQILRVPMVSVIGKSCEEFFSGANHWVVEAINQVMVSREPHLAYDTELFLDGVDGIPVNLTVVPFFNLKKEAQGAMLILENITKEKRLKGTLARYMTKEVAERLLDSEAELGGQMKEATVLFSDIRSFTTISERLGAQETVSMLNDYFTIMVDIIFRYGGILDKYIGDAIMAVFGTPFSTGEDADRAVKTAVDMLKALSDFNTQRLRDSKEPVFIGVGINTDDVLVGNIGSLKRMDYTVIGDGVNLASRLEGANKYYHSQILVSEFTFRSLKYPYHHREVDSIKVKGKNTPVKVFEILSQYSERDFPHLEEAIGLFGQGLEYYRKCDWERGVKTFRSVLGLNPRDLLSLEYIKRCEHFREEPPPPEWDGVWVMKDK
jgi:adenylate cyclase